MSAAITSSDIAEKIDALEVEIIDFEIEADEISLKAAAGDEAASQKLASLNASIEHGRGRLVDLGRAKVRAERIERRARVVADAADRARHMEEAKAAAEKLVQQAACVDAIIGNLIAELALVSQYEGEVHSALRAARFPPETAIVGRTGLVVLAIDRITNALSGRPYMANSFRPTEQIARTAWRVLLDDKAVA